MFGVLFFVIMASYSPCYAILLLSIVAFQISSAAKLHMDADNAAYKGEDDRTATLECSVDGYEILSDTPAVVLVWSKNGTDIPGDHSPYKINNTINGLSILTVSIVSEDVVGTYTCSIKDDDNTAPVTGDVDALPHCLIKKHGQKSLTVIAGNQLDVECVIFGKPLPEKKDVVFSFQAEGTMEYKKLPGDSVKITKDEKDHEFKKVYTLSVPSVNMTDRGTYVCNATNIHGVSDDTVFVRIKDPLAPLWPFIGVIIEIVILIIIIVAYEMHKKRKQAADDSKDSAQRSLINANSGDGANADGDKNVRQRK